MKITMILKIYLALALLAAAILAPLSLSVVPMLLLVWFLYQWWKPISPAVEMLTHYFLYFALALLYSLSWPAYLATLAALPALPLTALTLPGVAVKMQRRPSRHSRCLTGLALAIISLAFISTVLSVVLANLSLLLAGVLALLVFGTAICYLNRFLPAVPVKSVPAQYRMVTGQEETLSINLQACTKYGGLLYVEALAGWVRVESSVLVFQGGLPTLTVKVTPSLAGNAPVSFACYATDRWGLLQVKFSLQPLDLLVIPRARYADWLARQYLAGTKPGALPLLSNLSNLDSQHGLRQGIEYYGNRLYQPGDSLKNINWKYSTRNDELIVKEFTEFQGQPALILADLTTGNVDEADKLAYNVLATALTLAQNEVPVALAAFNSQRVIEASGILGKSQLVRRCLQLVKNIEIAESSRRFLNPPDVLRLRSNIHRLDQAAEPSAKALAELLRLEYQTLSAGAKDSPCTLAVSRVTARAGSSFSVILISTFSHDPATLAFNASLLTQKGFSVIQPAS